MKFEIELPEEFRSGNSIPVERATISRERMIEILHQAVDAYELHLTDIVNKGYANEQLG